MIGRGKLTIRAAAPADSDAVAICVDAAYRHYVERIGRAPGPMLDDYADVIRHHQVTIAELDGDVVGVLVLKRTGEGLLLDNVAVLPGFQGRGIGGRLLGRAEAEARRQGNQALLVYTNEAMTENLELYARRGFVEYARRIEDGFARVYMKKRLV